MLTVEPLWYFAVFITNNDLTIKPMDEYMMEELPQSPLLHFKVNHVILSSTIQSRNFSSSELGLKFAEVLRPLLA